MTPRRGGRLKGLTRGADTGCVRFCESCRCPAPATRERCAFCGTAIGTQGPVSFCLERVGNGYEWHTEGALVASASTINGLWQLHDARGAHVVTLVPMPDMPDGAPGLALVGPKARLLGSIRAEADGHGSSTIAADPDGRAVLVLRTDGGHAAHLVDRRGDVIAVASWDTPEAATDVLVTALGTRHSLAMVFGLLLSFEVGRRADRIA
jgi:hypothetical protein